MNFAQRNLFPYEIVNCSNSFMHKMTTSKIPSSISSTKYIAICVIIKVSFGNTFYNKCKNNFNNFSVGFRTSGLCGGLNLLSSYTIFVFYFFIFLFLVFPKAHITRVYSCFVVIVISMCRLCQDTLEPFTA